MEADLAVIETERLYLRHLHPSDVDALFAVVGDAKTMRYYPAPFSHRFVADWVQRNLDRYDRLGYGLFGVVQKESGQLIGDCGLVWQDVEGREELELGYHIRRDQWNRGYATEAAKACMDFAFGRAGVDHVISLIRPENLPSRRVAEKNGLSISKRITWKDLLHDVWSIREEDFKPQRIQRDAK